MKIEIEIDDYHIEELRKANPDLTDDNLHKLIAWGAEDYIERALITVSHPGPPQASVEQTKWVLQHALDHLREGGTYRNLIYDRLGFTEAAYAPLLGPGMSFSNEAHWLRHQIEELELKCELAQQPSALKAVITTLSSFWRTVCRKLKRNG